MFRRILMIVVVLAVVLALAVSTVGAQNDVCVDIGVETGGTILVDVPGGDRGYGCNVHTIVSKDVAVIEGAVEVFEFVSGGRTRQLASGDTIFNDLIRVCFNTLTPEDDLLIFHDADFRTHPEDELRLNTPILPILAGVRLGFACMDVDRPGTVRVLLGANTNPIDLSVDEEE
ncbi:MAG: hypothetical protein GYB67_14755 [Chloroflexi bacterium]|nr:hypothetical protein [Chloroflexota bacterium]